jgi:hypothetical protein
VHLYQPDPLAPQLAYPQSRGVGQEYEINENLQASITMHYSSNTHCRFHPTSTDSCELVKANEQIKKLGSEKAINGERKMRREGKRESILLLQQCELCSVTQDGH